MDSVTFFIFCKKLHDLKIITIHTFSTEWC